MSSLNVATDLGRKTIIFDSMRTAIYIVQLYSTNVGTMTASFALIILKNVSNHFAEESSKVSENNSGGG